MKDYLLVTEKLVGIQYHVDKVITLLNQSVKVVGILGMGGLGKTTMAMAVRDEVYTKFEYCFFLKGVRETLSNNDGIVALQRKIISAIPGDHGNILDASQGIRLIKDRVSSHRVLIIIDDADERFKFEQILGKLEDFSSESRFIITTRNRRVLEFFQHTLLYEPRELGFEHSQQLFSIHAFGLDYPREGWEDLSSRVVEAATCLPLALKVIGATLYGRDEWYWEEKLKQLRKIPHGEVQECLMISYVDLSREEKKIFLDIACNFIGERKEYPFYMWNSCDFFPEIGVNTLILKSLMKVNEENKFWMHDSIRDLGRAIVREEDPERPWRRSRIWSNEDALEMIRIVQGTDELEVFSVKFADSDGFKLTERFFNKSSSLRHLKVSGGEFEGNFESILPNLRWLQLDMWKMSKLKSLKLLSFRRESLLMENDDALLPSSLIKLHIRYSMLQRLPSLANLINLTKLFLRNTGVVEIRGLARLRNLETLEIQGARELMHLQGLEQLTELDISRCTQLTEVMGLEKLESVKTLLISDCPSIQSLPDFSGLKHLWKLDIVGCHTHLTAVTGLENLKELEFLTIDEGLIIPPLGSEVKIVRKSVDDELMLSPVG
ncbi:Disease resistance protein L6 [Linum grandiflorum]